MAALATASVCALCLNGAIGQSLSEETPPVARLTTDTVEYCTQLADMLGSMTKADAARPPPEVRTLSKEGARMCDEGQVRGGILRLRQAVTIMRQRGDGQ